VKVFVLMNANKLNYSQAAIRKRPRNRISPMSVFRARAEARAALFDAGELDLDEAVDALQAAAIRSNLLGEIGQDAVQAIMAEAFGRVR
jgi:hypothetical protein